MLSFMIDMSLCEAYMAFSLLGGIFLGIFIILVSYIFSKL